MGTGPFGGVFVTAVFERLWYCPTLPFICFYNRRQGKETGTFVTFNDYDILPCADIKCLLNNLFKYNMQEDKW